jgi:hypothetical protein
MAGTTISTQSGLTDTELKEELITGLEEASKSMLRDPVVWRVAPGKMRSSRTHRGQEQTAIVPVVDAIDPLTEALRRRRADRALCAATCSLC